MNMGSMDNQNLWPPPYDDSNGCSLRICSNYCPQLCHLNPPPPPEVDDSSAYFPRWITAVVVILAISFVIVSWFAIVKRHFQRTNRPTTWPTTIEPEENLDEIETPRDQSVIGSTGLDEEIVKTIKVCKYQKGDGLIEGTECAVCLSEFQENESLRLLPNCVHAFHLPCIDRWLKSHSNCPLCRVDVNVSYPLGPPVTNTQTHNVASLEVQQPNDLIFMVHDHSQEVVLTLSSDDDDDDDYDDDDYVTPKSP